MPVALGGEPADRRVPVAELGREELGELLPACTAQWLPVRPVRHRRILPANCPTRWDVDGGER
jgi:hypothetical protein